MRDPLQLVEYLESIGHGVNAESGQLRIAQGSRLPPSLLESLREHKQIILDMLQHDSVMKDIGCMVGITGTLYFKSISFSSTAYMELSGGEWLVYRQTDYSGQISTSRYKEIARGQNFDDVFNRFNNYLSYIESKQLEVSI